jgi:hypothetical protein
MVRSEIMPETASKTYDELVAAKNRASEQLKEVEAEIAALRQKGVNALYPMFEKLAYEHGLHVEEVMRSGRKQGRRRKSFAGLFRRQPSEPRMERGAEAVSASAPALPAQ